MIHSSTCNIWLNVSVNKCKLSTMINRILTRIKTSYTTSKSLPSRVSASKMISYICSFRVIPDKDFFGDEFLRFCFLCFIICIVYVILFSETDSRKIILKSRPIVQILAFTLFINEIFKRHRRHLPLFLFLNKAYVGFFPEDAKIEKFRLDLFCPVKLFHIISLAETLPSLILLSVL